MLENIFDVATIIISVIAIVAILKIWRGSK